MLPLTVEGTTQEELLLIKSQRANHNKTSVSMDVRALGTLKIMSSKYILITALLINFLEQLFCLTCQWCPLLVSVCPIIK
jgi:hypothetical protein